MIFLNGCFFIGENNLNLWIESGREDQNYGNSLLLSSFILLSTFFTHLKIHITNIVHIGIDSKMQF